MTCGELRHGGQGSVARDITRQTGHRSTIILRRYVREGSLFRTNAAAAIGL